MTDLVRTAFRRGATNEVFFGHWRLKYVNIKGRSLAVFSDGDFSVIITPEGQAMVYNDTIGTEICGKKICYTLKPSGEGWLYKEIREIERHRALSRDIAREY